MPARPARRGDYAAWGGTIRARHEVYRPQTIVMARAALAAATPPVLAYGCGRSYGDVCLNPDGTLIDCRQLDRFIAFDAATGILACEAGVQLGDILRVVCRPDRDGTAWFLPVLPGTRFVSVGGAIANDVHGKNHRQRGCFGNHVLSLEVARRDGSLATCSREQNQELFAATIGGLGLTGVIVTARLQLQRVPGTWLEAETVRLDNLTDFFAVSAEADTAWDYAAAWIDCLATGAALGRGIYSQARHQPGNAPPLAPPKLTIPITPPLSPLNRVSLRAFNSAYFHWHGRRQRHRSIVPYQRVLFPLDQFGGWNRLYGRQGFFQFQCVIPQDAEREAIADILGDIAASGDGSMLAVLKRFGDTRSPGLLSFPMPGTTLALDFPNRGPGTLNLLRRLEDIVVAAGGRLYPAKDATMRAETFRRGFHRLDEFLPHVDRGISSGFVRRMGLA